MRQGRLLSPLFRALGQGASVFGFTQPQDLNLDLQQSLIVSPGGAIPLRRDLQAHAGDVCAGDEGFSRGHSART